MVLDYKGIPVFYDDRGEGSVLLLLHGFLETSSMWDPLVPELSKRHRVVTLDLLGHGQTGCVGYVHTMAIMADVVYALTQHLKLDAVSLIGHSMGGYVALAFAEGHPKMVKGLCLMNSTFTADDTERQALRRRAIALAKTNYAPLVRQSFAHLFAPESRLKFKAAYEAALAIALQTPVQGYVAAQEGMLLRPDRFDVFKTLKAKKAISVGKKDTVVNADELKKHVRKTDIEWVEFSGGHMSYIEDMKKLLTFLLRYIEKL